MTMAFSKIDVCLICEGIRQEIGNKSVLLGFYGIAPYTQVHIQSFQAPVALCFVFSGGKGSAGRYRVSLRLTDPAGVVVSNPQSSPDITGPLGDRVSTNIFMQFYGRVTMPGTYRAALIVDDIEVFSTTITLLQAQQQITGPVPFLN